MADTHGAVAEHEHSPHLRHHFDDMEQQFDSATLGMWVFLLTEIMFFGGMFGAYTMYRGMYPEAFASTSVYMNPLFGAMNTAVLIVSSLTMALGVRAARLGEQKALQLFLIFTMIFGIAFLVIKGFEYHEHWVDMKVPLFPGHWDYSRVSAVCPPGADHVLLLLLYDRFPRLAHGGGRGFDDHDFHHGAERHLQLQLLYAGRNQRPVLALRGHRLDLPVPVTLFDRTHQETHLNICTPSLPFEPT